MWNSTVVLMLMVMSGASRLAAGQTFGEWSALPGPNGTGISGGIPGVYALTVFDDGSGPALYAGGQFQSAGGVTVRHIAKWDGSAWSALTGPFSAGVGGTVFALKGFHNGSTPTLYAGGEFHSAGGLAAVNCVAKWNGTEWSSLYGPSTAVFGVRARALETFDDGTGLALYVGGWFSTSGTVVAHNIGKWDGSEWAAVTGSHNTEVGVEVKALGVSDSDMDPALFIAGSFITSGHTTAQYVAQWDGVEWSSLTDPSGTGLNAEVRAISVFDDGTGPALYVGGTFTNAGGLGASRIARWNGSEWSLLSDPGGSGLNGAVNALEVFDDGAGPALYVGGAFTMAGGVRVENIAKWDGSAWSALMDSSGIPGVSGPVFCLDVFDDGNGPALYVGGEFWGAGITVVNYIAKWKALNTRPCIADYNGIPDAGDVLDFLDFFQDFGACEAQPAPCGTLGNPDVNGDTIIDILDFLDFLEAFGTGC